MRAHGNEVARVFTPPLRELTPDTTVGFDVVEFSEDVLGVALYPWQRWLLVHSLEIVGSFDGGWHFRFRTVLVLVARQNGKTMLGTVLACFFLYVLGVGLILGTAQDLEQAEDTWSCVVDMVQEVPELASEVAHVWFTNGAKRLQLTGGRQYRVKASTRRAGRGKSADLVFLDELREHQSWDGWSALSKTGMARDNCIVWCMSNAGDGTSVVLRHLRMMAHVAIGDPDSVAAELMAQDVTLSGQGDDLAADGALGIFEWSAPPGSDPADPDSWAHFSNPSLGWGITERAIRAAVSTDPVVTTVTETMCQWVTSTADPPFPAGAWEEGVDADSCIAPDSPLSFGLDVSLDRRHAAICVCGERADHAMHVELVAYEQGLGWVVRWFQDRVNRYGGKMRVALAGRGAPGAVFSELLAAVDGVEVTEVFGARSGAWCARLWDSVAALDPDQDDGEHAPEVGDTATFGDRRCVAVYHVPQPRLDLAANVAATRPVGDGAWVWDRRKSGEDISPLVAANMAFGLATEVAEEEVESVYAEHGVMFLD